MPAMSADQEAAWTALLDLYERVPRHWTLAGGQMVHLWCAERGWPQPRPTDDADAVVDVRADPNALTTFTGALLELGFTPEVSGDGVQHRWIRERNGVAAQSTSCSPTASASAVVTASARVEPRRCRRTVGRRPWRAAST